MIRRELAIFLVVGTLTVLLDFAVYRVLVAWSAASVDLAKGVGFLVGTVFAYFANRHWTFGSKATPTGTAWRFVLLYASTLAANVLLNAGVLAALAKPFASAWVPLAVQFGVHVAFVVATAASALLNFFGMKFFVFATPSRAPSA